MSRLLLRYMSRSSVNPINVSSYWPFNAACFSFFVLQFYFDEALNHAFLGVILVLFSPDGI